MKIRPYQKVACLKRTWQVAMEEVEEDPDWQAITFAEYNEFKNQGGLAQKSIPITCGRKTVWDIVLALPGIHWQLICLEI